MIAELRRATGEQARPALLKEVILLPITEEVERIAQIYINTRVMAQDPTGDALHLAKDGEILVTGLLCKSLSENRSCHPEEERRWLKCRLSERPGKLQIRKGEVSACA